MRSKVIVVGVTATLLSGLLSGCSIFGVGDSEYACPGMPKGVVCKTPREVYNMPDKGSRSKGKYNPGPVEVMISDFNGDTEPMPVLEQARVMRIWISPWHDSNNDLHWPGLVFTKIKGHEWAVGSSDFNGIEPPVPRRMGSELMPKKNGPKGQQEDVQPTMEDVLD